ncbi:MAG: mechanosensitive ion channel family protein [Chloroflexi bacterium]|nr:MAG: mechanosensitive ion channel family protein [Chloroflexota bacterium]
MQDVLLARLSNFAADAVGTILHILLILALSLVAYYVLRLVTRRLERMLARQGDGLAEEREQYATTISSIVRSTGLVLIVIVAGIMILAEFGLNITPLLAGAGIIGLAAGFGAQTLVKDVISGLFILAERQFSVGDSIQVGDIGGSVEKMTLRATFLRDVNGTRHVIPNGEIRILSNRTEGWAQSVLDIGIGYDESIGRAMGVLQAVGDELAADPEFNGLLLDRPAVVGVQELADSAVVLRMTAKTRPGKQFAVTRELRRRVKERFDAEGIDIPYPTQVHLTRVVLENKAPVVLENPAEIEIKEEVRG